MKITMTDENLASWNSTISIKYQMQRLQDWANMLEQRVAELDPDYRSYAWGKNFIKESV
jgi:hypothetical protein